MTEQQIRKPGRPPKDNARTATMQVRVLPSAKAAFIAEARRRGVDLADAHREALRLWMS